LEQLVTIKTKRYEQALKLMEEKTTLLEKEKKILQEKESEKEEILLHKQSKMDQLRNLLDEGTTSDKIQLMKNYLQVVDEKVYEKEREVERQKGVVEKAKKELEIAKTNFFQRKKDLEKLEIHRTEWQKEVKHWILHQEEIEQDEQGSTKHILKKQEEKKRK
ncbi:MAG: type III secretion T3S chaperone, partial [Chlamydiota bacterium]